MITKLSKILVIAAALSVGTNVYAYDFEADGIYYNIISSTEKTVEVTFQSLDKWGNPKSYYSGNVVIPKQVLYNNNIYSVTFINSYAFRNCSELTSVTIPSSITTIDSYAFRNCSNLEAVNISDLSAWCKINFSNTYSNPLHEAHNLYLNGLLIKNLTIPDDIAEIKDYTFYGCNCLTSVTIPDNVTSIGENVFYDCSGLTSLTIGASILSIGTSAFYNTDLTKTVWLPNTPPKGYEYVESKCNYVANESYTRLDNQTVYPYLSSMFETGGLKYVPVSPSERTCDAIDCSYDNTADIVIGKTVNYKGIEMTLLDVKGYLCYDNDSIKTLIIDGYEGNIGEEAFYDCNSLKIVNINDIKGEIGNSAFSYCPILETARLTNIGGNIGSISFYCTGLKTITITNIEGNIGEMAFYNCTSLEEVNISKVEGYIGRQAFDSCANLKTVDINDIGGEIQYQIFDGCTNLKNVTISNISGNIGESAFLDCI